MKKTTTAKRSSAQKKLIPAAGALMVSAAMLGTSTFAWFTMSREVEVQNIQMTATVPEDIQISLGTIYNSNAATAVSTSESFALNGSTGWLKEDSNGVATAPREQGTVNNELDWSNIADISAYYQFGKLIPASSINGEDVFFTPNASGVGRTLAAGAAFYQAADGLTAQNEAGDGNGGGKYNATAHIFGSDKTNATTHTWAASAAANDGGYVTATGWNATNDDGYYVDIPVWLRTSSTAETKLYVTGYVTDKTEENGAETDDLYQAVRVAILTDQGAADKGCLTLLDGGDTYIDPVSGVTTHNSTFPANLTQTATNILDSDNYNGTGDASTNKSKTAASARVANQDGIYAVSGTGNSNAGAWDTIVQNNASDANDVVTLNVGTGSTYGDSKKVIIRVWLEGEDGNCWNENAGQDWNIALKFSKTPLAAPTSNP